MAPQPAAPAPQPPPELPSMPDVSATLTNYLRTFALWCSNGFANKMSITSALRGVMLQANDVGGSNPPVYTLGVTSAGTATLAPMALGSGAMGAAVPVGQTQPANQYVNGAILVTATPEAGDNAYVGFVNESGARIGYVGLVGGAISLHNDQTGASIDIDADGYTRFSGTLVLPYFLAENQAVFNQPGGVITQGGSSYTLIQAPANNEAMISFLCQNQFGVNLGLNPNSYLYMGGWSFGEVRYQMWTSRDFANPACDYRIKEDVKPLASTWDDVKALRPVSYRQKEFTFQPLPKSESAVPLIEADPRERWGFVAHELQDDLIETAATVRKDHPDQLQAPNLMAVVAALTRTVQELQARVEELEAAR
jgi:hypothetical protein